MELTQVLVGLILVGLVVALTWLNKLRTPSKPFATVNLCLWAEEHEDHFELLKRFSSFRIFPRVGDTLLFGPGCFKATEVVLKFDGTVAVWCDETMPKASLQEACDLYTDGGWYHQEPDGKFRPPMYSGILKNLGRLKQHRST